MARRITAVIAALVLLTAAVTAVWYVKTGRELDRVGFTAGLPQCTGTTITTIPDEDTHDVDPPMLMPLIRARRGMHCTLTYRAELHPPLNVRISRVRVPLGGPDAASSFIVTRLQYASPRPAADGTDVVWSDGPPDGPTHVVIEIGFRQNGCMEKGSAGTIDPWVTLTLHGRHVRRALPIVWVSGGGLAATCFS